MTVDRVRALFEDDQVYPGASEQELQEVECKLGIVLPNDMRSFYKKMNGSKVFTDLEYGHITFWQLSQLKTVSQEFPSEKRDCLSDAILFSDHLIWSWAFAGIVLPRGKSETTEFHVYVIGVSEPGEPIARTFSEFLELVLKDDLVLYG